MSRSEKTIFTNMCMIQDEQGSILVQERLHKDWPGITFPGGHVEKGESFTESVIREVYEETGLTITSPVLCGIKQFQTNADERYVVLFYRTDQFTGTMQSSDEGEVFWIHRDELTNYQLANDFEQMIRIFESDTLHECFYLSDSLELQLR